MLRGGTEWVNLKVSEADTFAGRLANLIKEGMSYAEVGRAVGVSGQAVGKWAKDGNISSTMKTASGWRRRWVGCWRCSPCPNRACLPASGFSYNPIDFIWFFIPVRAVLSVP